MKKLSLCIFDMDGLLINSERQMWMHSEKIVFASLGYEVTDEFLRSLMGLSGDDLKNQFTEVYGSDFPYDFYTSEVARLNEEVIKQGAIDLMPGTKELLDFLKENKIKCVIGTGTPKDRTVEILTKLGLINYFEEIYSGCDVKHGKPAPDIYLKCLGNTSNDEALVFEDSLNGARASFAANIRLIAVPDLCHFPEEDRKKAYRVLNNLNEAIPLIKEIIK